MGEVYRARDTKLNREVAIKIVPQLLAGNPERRARFEREAQVLASLNHPHIAAVQPGSQLVTVPLEDGAAFVPGRPTSLLAVSHARTSTANSRTTWHPVAIDL
jgi:serine/threonine protein kinase